MLNLPVQSLEYDDIRSKFVDFLKADNVYKDFNFDASGISAQMNIMAYHAHMMGFFVKMLLDESFVDSAHTLKAQRSHAKKTGYVPKGRRSARADLKLVIEMTDADAPVNDIILIPAGSSFSGANNTQDKRVFHVLDDVTCTDSSTFGSVVTYTSPEITAYEGTRQSWKFRVDSSVVGQNFVIKDANCDVDSIRIRVKADASSTTSDTFLPAKYLTDIDPTSKVFYVTTNEDGFFQVFFGEDVYGVQPATGNVVEATYIATNGETGNGAKVFTFNPPSAVGQPPYHVGNFSDFEIELINAASGGMEPETVDSMRFTIPNHYRRQNRVVTESDYYGILMEEFRNIDSLNVWGGERAKERNYGKVFCSIKPKNSLALTGSAKREISDKIVSTFGVVGTEVVFVDPQYIDAEVTVTVKISKNRTDLTSSDVESVVTKRIWSYADTTLNKFQVFLSDVAMLNAAQDEDTYIASLYSTKTLKKETKVVYGTTGATETEFSNPLRAATIKSSAFMYGGVSVYISDTLGSLYIRKTVGDALVTGESIGTVDYDTGEISYTFPASATVPGYTGLFGVVDFTGDAVNPDVNTSLNNIVRITKVRVNAA